MVQRKEMNKSIRAVVLAAGKGSRMKTDIPKVLHPLFGKPLLARAFDPLERLGIKDIDVVLGHGKPIVEEWLKDYQSTAHMHPVHQTEQRGTGHALQVVDAHWQKAQPEISPEWVLVTSGDVPFVSAALLKTLLETHQATQETDPKVAMTLVTARMDHPDGYGRVVIQDEWVHKIVEDKDATLEEKVIQQVNAGIYCFSWALIRPLLSQLSSNNAQGEYYLTDLVSLCLKAGHRVRWCESRDPLETFGINNQLDLATAHHVMNNRSMNQLMVEGVIILDPPNTFIAPEVRIDPGTIVFPGCVLMGSIYIGSHCQIGPNTVMQGMVQVGEGSQVVASVVKDSVIGSQTVVGPFAHLRDGTELRDQVRIGNFVEVKNTYVAAQTNAAHLSYLGDASLGQQVNIGAGTITANYDPIRQEKHRTVLEDHVKIGCNAVLVAPLTVGHHATVAAGSVITESVEPWDLAIARPRQGVVKEWVSRVTGVTHNA